MEVVTRETGPRLTETMAGELEALKVALRERLDRNVPELQIDGLPMSRDELAAEVSAALAETFDTPVVEICLAGWRKWRELRALTDPRQHPPDSIHRVPLFEHRLRSAHKPRVAILLNETSVAELVFDFDVTLDLKGFHLVIRDGRITAVECGDCRLRAKLSYAGQELWQHDFGKIALPGRVDFPEGVAI